MGAAAPVLVNLLKCLGEFGVLAQTADRIARLPRPDCDSFLLKGPHLAFGRPPAVQQQTDAHVLAGVGKIPRSRVPAHSCQLCEHLLSVTACTSIFESAVADAASAAGARRARAHLHCHCRQ